MFDWDLVTAPWSAEAWRSVIDRRERLFGPDRLPDPRALEPRPAPARLAPRDVGRDRRRRRDREGGRGPAAGPARDAVPLLRRGDRDGRRADPDRRDRRSAGPPRRARVPVVEPRPVPDAHGLDRRAGRRVHDRPAVDPDRRRRTPPERGGRGSRTLARSSATYLRLLAARRSIEALRRGDYETLDAGEPDVLAWRRATDGSQAIGLVNFAGAERRVVVPWPDAVRAAAGTHLDPPIARRRRRAHAAAARGRDPDRNVSGAPRRAATIRPGPAHPDRRRSCRSNS